MKTPLNFCRVYVFMGGRPWDAATPMRAMAQWLKRREDDKGMTKGIVVGVVVDYDDEGHVSVCLTYEHPNTERLDPIPAPLRTEPIPAPLRKEK